MPPRKPLSSSSSSVNSKKRKSDSFQSDSPEKPGPSKVRRKTLDAFFSPLATVHTKLNNIDPATRVHLNIEQTAILRMVEEGKNVFFTGSAGTGKSLLLRAIISTLKTKYAKHPEAVSVTASTGMAASNIGGMTVHAWGAVAPGIKDLDKLISYIKTCKPALQRWRKTKVLIIDEVSMLDGPLFQRLSDLADELRKKTERPFGGIQLVVTGDFFQLPPVTKGSDPIFAFECEAWQRCMENTVTLLQVFRQKDKVFVDMLNQLRKGIITPEATQMFTSLARPIQNQFPSLSHCPSASQPPAAIEATELFPLRIEVDRANTTRLCALPGPVTTFHSIDFGTASPEKRDALLANMPAPPRLHLKPGAQVMLLKNIDAEIGLVNGSVGALLGFWRLADVRAAGAEIKQGSAVARRVNIGDDYTPAPLPKPDACRSESSPRSLVSSQEKDKENVDVDEAKPSSSARPKDGIRREKDDDQYPLVLFPTNDNSDAEAVLLMRDEFRVEDNEGKLLARRMQIPLTLAWAMSIHKSQGQTIQRVKVNLQRVFEKGQSYVALSRAASLDGLQVLNFNPKKVVAHPKVIKWHSALEERSQSQQAQ